MEQVIALWPLAVVVGLAAVFIRLGRKPRSHKIRGAGDYSQDAEGRQGHRTKRDGGDGFDGGGGGNGGGD